jgi:hypothetical protein
MYETEQEKEVRLRRLAAQVIIMLPETLDDAHAVLTYTAEMLRDFITPQACRTERACSRDEPSAENVTLFPSGRLLEA